MASVTSKKTKGAKKMLPEQVKQSQQSGGEFPTNWDIDSYRTEYESEEHWTLRRRFMEMYKDKFPEEKLVCLAQVFTNMEFLGCKYPAETMRLVGELSQEVAKEFRAEHSTRLKRTFVAASDAAEQRAKGRRMAQQQQQQQPQQQQRQQQSSFRAGNKRACFGDGSGSGQDFDKKRKINQSDGELFKDLKFGKLVLSLFGGRNCIRLSAQNSNMEYHEVTKETKDGKKQIEIFVDSKLITQTTESNLKLAKEASFKNAMEILRKECYAIKPNPSQSFIKVDKQNDQIVCNIEQEEKLSETNKGFNMMKKMGWTGGGLGAKKQGREDPVEYLFKSNRSGLGSNDKCQLDRGFYHNMLKNYVQSEDIRELRFEVAFTKNERAWLHELSAQYSLKSRSRGNEDNRCLYIFKKNPNNPEIVKEILINNNQKYRDKFLLQVPGKKAHLFPDFTNELEVDN